MSHTEGVLTRATLDEGLGLVGDMAAPSSSADSTECALDQQIQVPWMQAVTVDHSIGYWITPHIYIVCICLHHHAFMPWISITRQPSKVSSVFKLNLGWKLVVSRLVTAVTR